MSVRKPIQIIQGGQYGSEAKGAVAAFLCLRDNVEFAVRTGATNAGHTVYYGGTAIKMQQLPVGWVNPNTTLVIGAGALVDIEILNREIQTVTQLTGHDVRRRLIIDHRASVHKQIHHERASLNNRHHLIGATGKGCSEALIDKVRLRGREPILMGELYGGEYNMHDTAYVLNAAYDAGKLIQLEGTQGTLLDLHFGPYPYVTHKPTGPAQWMVEAGLSPALQTEIWMVLRTFPIRVAGNSGPLPHETSWPLLAERINYKLIKAGRTPLIDSAAIGAFLNAQRELAAGEFYRGIPQMSDGTDQHLWSVADRVRYGVALSELNAEAWSRLSDEHKAELGKLFELTTVTKKLRRIAEFDGQSVWYAAQLARPHKIAVTFMNYLFPESWGQCEPGLSSEERVFIDNVENICNASVRLVNFGADPECMVAL